MNQLITEVIVEQPRASPGSANNFIDPVQSHHRSERASPGPVEGFPPRTGTWPASPLGTSRLTTGCLSAGPGAEFCSQCCWTDVAGREAECCSRPAARSPCWPPCCIPVSGPAGCTGLRGGSSPGEKSQA